MAAAAIVVWLSGQVVNRPEDGFATSGEPERPSIRLAATTLDGGRVMQGDRVHGAFDVRNIGTGQLTLAADEGHCPCLRVLGRRQFEIASGEEVQVTVEADTSLLQGVSRLPLVLRTNDPLVGDMVVHFELFVTPAFTSEPSAVEISPGSAGRRVAITGSSLWTPLAVRSTNPLVAARLETASATPAKTHIILLAARGGLEVGQRFGVLVVDTGHPAVPTVRVPVTARGEDGGRDRGAPDGTRR